MRHSAYVSLGSNLGDSKAILEAAIAALDEDGAVLVDAVSACYRTAPVGGVKQPDFLNAAARLLTDLAPEELLDYCQEIEQRFHRERKVHWGPRTLDIDILFYDDVPYTSARLTIPHPELFRRRFVLVPLKEVYTGDAYREQIKEALSKLADDAEQRVEKVAGLYEQQQAVEQAVRTLLSAFGEDIERPGLVETPRRVYKMYRELLSSTAPAEFTNYKTFHSPASQDEMIIIKNIPFYSLCEHHLLPFFGTVTVAYYPSHDRIVGLSKIPRLVDFVSHKLNVQEELTQEIGTRIETMLEPAGVAVKVKARHLCMEMRGVRTHQTETETTYYAGRFKDEREERRAFLWQADHA